MTSTEPTVSTEPTASLEPTMEPIPTNETSGWVVFAATVTFWNPYPQPDPLSWQQYSRRSSNVWQAPMAKRGNPSASRPRTRWSRCSRLPKPALGRSR